MSRKNTILVALLIAQLALIAFLYRPGRDAAAPLTPFFPGLDAGKVERLTIADDESHTVTLTKVDGQWTVGPEKFPADTEQVQAVVKKLSELKPVRLVARTKESHSRLKVADGNASRRIELGLSGGGEEVLFLGTSSTSKTIHARKDGAAEVHLANDLSTWELQATTDSWWKTRYVDLDEPKVQECTLTNAHGSFTLARDGEGKWSLAGALAGQGVDQEQAKQFVNSAIRITVSGYLTQEQGAQVTGEPVARLDFRVKDQPNPVTLSIWPASPKNTDETVVRLSTAQFHAKVRSYVLKDFLERQAASLAAKAAAPTEGAASPAEAAGQRALEPPPAFPAPQGQGQ